MDTRTITKRLISMLRKLKLEKQLFLVCHSVSVIINGESDKIVYAKENKGVITYDHGSIIESRMKNNIVITLDDGQINFKMRLNKYDFNMEEHINY